MQDALLSEEHRETIRRRMGQEAIFVEMKARRLRNRIVDAVVINARAAQLAEVSAARGSRKRGDEVDLS